MLGPALDIYNSIFVYKYTWDFVTRDPEKTSRNIGFCGIFLVLQEFDNKLILTVSCHLAEI